MGVSGFRQRTPTDRAFSVRQEYRWNSVTGQAWQLWNFEVVNRETRQIRELFIAIALEHEHGLIVHFHPDF